MSPEHSECSCWLYNECKAVTALYGGHFSRLFLQEATLKDKMSLPKELVCLELTIKTINSYSVTTHCMYSIHLGPSTSPSGAGGHGEMEPTPCSNSLVCCLCL